MTKKRLVKLWISKGIERNVALQLLSDARQFGYTNLEAWDRLAAIRIGREYIVFHLHDDS